MYNSVVCSTFNVKCSWDGLLGGRNCSCVWSFWCSDFCSIAQTDQTQEQYIKQTLRNVCWTRQLLTCRRWIQWWQSRTVSAAPVAGWTSSAGEGSTVSAGPFSQCTQCDCPTSGVSFIKLSVYFILKVYVCVIFFRFIKPCVCQNLRKKPLINPSQGNIVRMCISTPSPPRNHHVWNLHPLVLLCITSSSYNFHAYSHPRDTCLTPSKVQDIKEWDPDCNSIWAIAYNWIFIAKKYPVSLLRFIMKISLKTKHFTIVDQIFLHRSYSISIILNNSNKIKFILIIRRPICSVGKLQGVQ